MELAMKKVLITGGTRGIGRALAEALQLEGCEVMVCGSSAAAAAQTQAETGIRAIACDLTSADGVAQLSSAVRGELGGLDLLVNNAGVQLALDFGDQPSLQLARQELELNLMAPIALTAALLPTLLASATPVVVNVTSALAFAATARAPVYAASKAGLSAFTRCLRAQLADTPVRVVEVVPPLVATAMTEGRQRGAITTQEMAQALVAGLRRDATRMLIGKARVLAAINRVSPALAEYVVRDR